MSLLPQFPRLPNTGAVVGLESQSGMVALGQASTGAAAVGCRTGCGTFVAISLFAQ